MSFTTRSGRPTFWPPDDPRMTDCCHSVGEWCSRSSWAAALAHARERAALGRFRQHVYRSRAHEENGQQCWIVSVINSSKRRPRG